MVESSGEKPQFSPEDEAFATGINNKTDFYEILGVEKTATDDQLKKAYRKLALKVHPDKNRAPSAQEAFKKVGQAYACLSDSSKRKHYDMFGKDMDNNGGPQFADFNPDELFRQFFGNGGLEEIFAQAFGQQMGGRGRGRPGSNPLEQMFAQAMQGGMGRGGGMGGGGPQVFQMSFGGPMGGGMRFQTMGGGDNPFQQFTTGPQRRRQQQFRESEEAKSERVEDGQDQDEDDLQNIFRRGFAQGAQAGRGRGQDGAEVDLEKEIKKLCLKCCAGCFVMLFVAPYVISAVIRLFFSLFGVSL